MNCEEAVSTFHPNLPSAFDPLQILVCYKSEALTRCARHLKPVT
jgi:hypothetical protein